MKNRMEKEYRIPVSLSDNTARLNYHGFFTVFMDLASEHGSDLGMGMDDLAKKGLIWLATKTKIRIYERPRMFSTVTVATWPGEPGRARCNRYYTMMQDGRLIAEAKNEWAMIEPATGKLHRISDAYSRDMEHCPDIVCDVPFFKVSDDFDTAEKLWDYTVLSTDLDTSNHMNNVAYTRAVFGAYSSDKLSRLPLTEIEIAYKQQCFEGENLTFKIRDNDTGCDIGIIKDDGRTAATMRLIYK